MAFTIRRLGVWDPMLSSDCDTRLCSGYVMNVSSDLGSILTGMVGVVVVAGSGCAVVASNTRKLLFSSGSAQ